MAWSRAELIARKHEGCNPRFVNGLGGYGFLISNLIERAARYEGRSVSDFVVTTVQEAANANLGHSRDVFQLQNTLHRIAVRVFHAIVVVHQIQMRIELNHMNRSVFQGPDNWKTDGMIAAKH